MKWVKCVRSDERLTLGKTYKVLSTENYNFSAAIQRYYNLKPEDCVMITFIDDLGKKDSFFLKTVTGIIWFEDVTTEIRDNKINKILDEVG